MTPVSASDAFGIIDLFVHLFAACLQQPGQEKTLLKTILSVNSDLVLDCLSGRGHAEKVCAVGDLVTETIFIIP